MEEKIRDDIIKCFRKRRGENENISLFQELIHFLCVHSVDELLPPQQIDEVWCDLILETQTYRNICYHLFKDDGFRHRNPSWKRISLPNPVKVDEYGVMIYFRNMIPSQYLPLPKKKELFKPTPFSKSLFEFLPLIRQSFSEDVGGDENRLAILAQETLGFLILKSKLKDVHSKYQISPPAVVDLGWHALIGNTQLYEEICQVLVPFETTIIEHSMFQDDMNGRVERLGCTFNSLKSLLPSHLHEKIDCDPENADWVGYQIPIAFSYLLDDHI